MMYIYIYIYIIIQICNDATAYDARKAFAVKQIKQAILYKIIVYSNIHIK